MRTQRARAFAFLAVLAALPGVGAAMEATCDGCLGQCCNWAFSAKDAFYSRTLSIDAYSRYVWERYGYDPVPCREVLHDPTAYQRCVNKAFDRCYASRCRGCRTSWIPFKDFFQRNDRTQSVVFYPGQEIIIEADPDETPQPPAKPRPAPAPPKESFPSKR